MFAPLLALLVVAAAADPRYRAEIEKWRAEREMNLQSDTGWLTVAGLFWLHEGDNGAGNDPSAVVVLPAGAQSIGRFHFENDKASFHPAAGVAVSLNGSRLAGPTALRSDAGGAAADVLSYLDSSLLVIKRGERHAVRMRDKNSAMRRDFKGLHWFDVRDDLRFEAKFTSYPQPRTIAVPNVLNQEDQQTSIGYATFHYQGTDYKLEPVVEDDQLFYIFKDLTAGKETYPAGRFLYSDRPKNGKVILDFNKAYNPPCAFTPYATCPLPPKQNRLPIRMEAGELKYDH